MMKSILIIVFALIIPNKCDISIKLSMDLVKSGFHRDIIYNLEFHPTIKSKCEFNLVQDLPSSIYVDMNQLNDFKKFKKIFSYVPAYINTELSRAKSNGTQIFLFGVAKRNVYIRLPIHLRYDTPGYTKFVKAEIESPKIYIRCEDDEELMIMKGHSTYSLPCSNSAGILDFDELKFADYCDWEEHEFINTQPKIITNIPIGNKGMTTFVTITTILTSWMGCIYVLISLFKMKKINKKL